MMSLLMFVGCDLETNTVNPQMSKTIKESREYDLLQSIGEPKQNDKSNFVKEIWIEKSWKNSIRNGKKYRELLGSLNIVVSLNKGAVVDMKDWRIMDSNGRILGSGNGVFDLYNVALLDSVSLFMVRRKDSTKVNLGTYIFHKIGK